MPCMAESSEKNRPRHGGADLISALPDDLLLQVLERLGSVAAAARTGLLARRWRDLWTLLPKATVAIHDVPFGSIEAALRYPSRPMACHYYLSIRVPRQDNSVTTSGVSSLLHAAALLSPVELLLTLPRDLQVYGTDGELPSFRRATCMDLRLWVRGCTFPSLERLTLSGCRVDLAALIHRCPRLRVLTLNSTGSLSMGSITVHSASLQELVVEKTNTWTSHVDIQAPVLKQLTMSIHARDNLLVSVSVPLAEKVSWRCSYARAFYGLGIWGLMEVSLESQDRPGHTGSAKDACSQLPTGNVMYMHMCAQSILQDSFYSTKAELQFEAEINRHILTNFSALDLHLATIGHSFAAYVLRLLGIHRILTAIHNLKIVLLRSEVKDACQAYCLCDEPKHRRTQSFFLANLEKVEIEGIEGNDHEFDFLKVIFRCAPTLKSASIRVTDGATPSVDWCKKINNIFMAYPSVECSLDLSSGPIFSSQSGALT